MKTLQRRLLLVAFASFAVLCREQVVVVTAQLAVNVSITHINDIHSNMEELELDLPRFMLPPAVNESLNEHNDDGDDDDDDEAFIRMRYGSMARVVALMKQMTETATIEGHDNILRLHAGDAMTGTQYFSYFGPAVDAAVLNLAGLDAMTIGNHEFDKGDAVLADFIKNLTFPVLSANVVPHNASALIDDTTGRAIFEPYIVQTLTNGERLGICGITTKAKTELSSFPDPGTTVRVETLAATECTKNLTSMGVNKIVLLTHIGYDNDLDWMAQIPNVDVVVGGDSHSLLGDNVTFTDANLIPEGPYATMVGNVCIVQAWEYSKIVGRLNVQFDAQGNVTSCTGTPLIPFNDTAYTIGSNESLLLTPDLTQVMTESLLARGIFVNVTPDANVAAVIAPYTFILQNSSGTIAGEAATTLCHARGQTINELCLDRPVQSCLGGGGVCYLVAQGFLFNAPTADFAIQNSGGCRSDILQGDITYKELFNVLPFANTLVTLNLTGLQIKNALEDGVNFFLNETIGGKDGSYPFAAGLRWDVNYSAPFGSRFSDIEMNRRLEDEWTPLDMTSTYTVVTNSFIGQGRDGYFTFLEPSVESTYVDTFVEYAQSFINYIEDKNTSISDPPLTEFSTQRLSFLNGSQCDADNPISPIAPSPTVPDDGAMGSSGANAVATAAAALASLPALVSGMTVAMLLTL